MSEIVKIENICKGIKGRRVGGDSENESDDYYVCSECGQAVYMGDLGAVFHHEEKGHKPITCDA